VAVRLLSVAEAGRYLSVHPRTVRRLVDDGTLRRVRAPVRRFLVDRGDLDQIVERWKAR
jgi:excisionase family DNA binding protein